MNRLFAAFVVLFALFCAPSVFAEDTISDVMITKTQGDVSLIREGSTLPAKEGTALKAGDTLKTAAGSNVDFSMNALAGCRVLPDSEVLVKDPKKNTMLVKLGSGKAVFNLEKLPQESSFRVETPTAIASVRGTQFLGSVSENGSTFAVRDDTIEVFQLSDGEPVGKSVTIEAGFSCDITGSGFDTRAASGAELTSMEQVASVKTCG
jgi:hypothetical protein